MPSLAGLFGFARAQGPWNSYPSQLDAPQAPQTPPADPWWLHGLIAPSSQAGLASTFARPLDTASFEPTPSNGGILGNFAALQGAPDALPSGGILQGLFPDAPSPGGGILGNLVPPPRGPNAAASGGILRGAFPEAAPDANSNAGDRLGPAPFFLLGADSPGIFNSPTRATFAPPPLSSGNATDPQDPAQQEALWRNGRTASPFTFWPGQPFVQLSPLGGVKDPGSTASSAAPEGPLESTATTLRPIGDRGAGQPAWLGQTVAKASNDETAATAVSPDGRVDPATDLESGDLDASFARAYDRARAIIASDSELSTTVRMAENSGDATFHDRLATIIANLEQNPEAALDAIQSEVFASKMRSMQTGSGTDFNSAHATRKAVDRLDALWPKLGIVWAREDALEPFRRYSEDQIRTFNRIWHSPMPAEERRELLDREGLFDLALASDWALGFVLPSRLSGPSDRPGSGPGNSPSRSQANPPKISEASAARSASESPGLIPTQKLPDPKVSRPHIEEFRGRIGVPDRHTVGVARTNVPGLEDMKFEGASPKVRYEAGLPRANPGPIVTPAAFTRYGRHAEEDIANQFVRAVEERGLKPSDLDGHKLVIHISNPNGVCPTCRLGLDSDAPAGVLKQLSERYPGLSIRITAETQPGVVPSGLTNFTIQNGRYISRSNQ
jgi:hypothetical protein